MRKFILLFLFHLGLSTIVSAQLADTLFVSKLNDVEWVKSIPNSTKFKILKFADNSCLQLGEKMIIGKPSGTNLTNQQSTGIFNTTSKVGNNFSYLMLGRMGSAIFSGVTYLPETFKGNEVEIEDIKFVKNGKKATSAGVMLIFKNPGMDITVLNLDFALKYGELINPKATITSDQALSELKRAKDKLDLGLITQEQFNVIKDELGKYIK